MKIYENSCVSKNYVYLFLFLHILIPAYLYHVFFFQQEKPDLYRKLGNLHQEDASKGPNMVIFGCYLLELNVHKQNPPQKVIYNTSHPPKKGVFFEKVFQLLIFKQSINFQSISLFFQINGAK